MKITIVFILLCFLTSCSLFKNGQCDRLVSKEKRVLAKIKEKCKDCVDPSITAVKLDTSIKKQEISGEIKLNNDTIVVDSLLKALSDTIDILIDENNSHEEDKVLLKSKIRELEYRLKAKIDSAIVHTKNIPKAIEGDTLDLKYKIWQEGDKLKFIFTKKEQVIELKKNVDTLTVNCPPLPFYKDKWFWMFCTAVLIIVLLITRRK